MTTIMIALVFSSLGVVAASVAFAFYEARLLSKAMSRADDVGNSWKTEMTTNIALQRQLAEAKRFGEDLTKSIGEKESELDREVAARKVAEKQRDEFLSELAKGGDPAAVAARINQDLQALAGMSAGPAAGPTAGKPK